MKTKTRSPSALTCAVTEQGISMLPNVETRFVQKTGDWVAQWIWLSDVVYPNYQECRRTTFCEDKFKYAIALFRKVVDLPFTPKKVTAWISGDTKYRCAINGKTVSRGPAEVGGDYGNKESPDWWFYDGFELGSCMKRGRNIVTAEVVLGPQVQADYSMGQGGFLLELLVEGPRGESVVIGTDDTWPGIVSKAAVNPNVYDAREEACNRASVDFNDSDWPKSRIIGPALGSKWNLLPGEIPQLMQARVLPAAVQFPCPDLKKRFDSVTALLRQQQPVHVKPGCPMVFWLRFPFELAGYLVLDLEGATGTRVEVNFQESPGVHGETETFILPDHRWTYETRRLQGFEFIQVTITFPGGTYCRTPLTIFSIAAMFTSFPVEYKGRFECSDTFLNRLWAVGRWTNQLCMQAYHLDSPIHQEGLGCTGDYMIEALISYCCFGEARLARKDILRTAYLLKQKQSRMFHTSYSLLWTWMLMDYWKFSRDEATVREVMPMLHDLLDLFESYVGESGIITEAPNYMFMDWVHVDGFALHHPPGCMGQGYMSAMYYQALLYGSEFSLLCGESARSRTYSLRAESLKRAFNERLWDSGRSLYCDGLPNATKTPPNTWLPQDQEKRTFTVHTNAMAIAVGIAGAEVGQNIMHTVMRDESLPMVQPYYMHFVFDALAKTGLFGQYAFDAMCGWKTLLAEHASSLKEGWDFGDYSHAWGGTSTYQLSTRVLGVAVGKTSDGEVTLSPCLGPLKWARGVVPAPCGLIDVEWKKRAGRLSGKLTGPAGCIVKLYTNGYGSGSVHIAMNGKRVHPSEAQDGSLSWKLKKGVYRISIKHCR